jgi:hypothetical protein
VKGLSSTRALSVAAGNASGENIETTANAKMLLFMMSLLGFVIEIYFGNVDVPSRLSLGGWMSGALCFSGGEELVSSRTRTLASSRSSS